MQSLTTDPGNLLDRLVDRARNLYSLPRVAAQVLQLTADPQVNARRLKECIENDPALTGKILRMVNSSLFGLPRTVRDLNQALALLGTKPLKLLVLGFNLPDALFRDLAGDFLARYWQRTLIKAVAARELCQSAWRMSGDEAFLAALLQQVGMLALAQDLGTTYVRLVERSWSEGADLASVERATLGFDHGELTARLLESWQLPDTLVAAARLPQSAEPFERLPPTKRALPQVLWLAELFARLLADGRSDALSMLLAEGQACTDLAADPLAVMVGRLQSKVEQLAEVLSLHLPAGRNYSDLLTAAHRQLAEVAAEAAGDLAAGQIALWAETRSLAAMAESAVRRRPTDGSDARLVTAPLTSQEHDPAFAARVAVAAMRCRAGRQPLSLLLVELDRYADLIFRWGPERTSRLLRRVESRLIGVDCAGASIHESREATFAVVLPGCDRTAAVEWGHHVLDAVRGFGASSRPDERISVSMGLAAVRLPPKNFVSEDLIEAADRCLFATKNSGGNAVKSIELI
jgi:HD-like signal output (HDOD) protein/GGDEF domain-containing protein